MKCCISRKLPKLGSPNSILLVLKPCCNDSVLVLDGMAACIQRNIINLSDSTVSDRLTACGYGRSAHHRGDCGWQWLPREQSLLQVEFPRRGCLEVAGRRARGSNSGGLPHRRRLRLLGSPHRSALRHKRNPRLVPSSIRSISPGRNLLD